MFELKGVKVVTKDESIEEGAAIAHSQWSGWMKYLFSHCEIGDNGTAIIPAWAVSRWQKQMNTPYAQLPEEDKPSDREEAQKYIDWLHQSTDRELESFKEL